MGRSAPKPDEIDLILDDDYPSKKAEYVADQLEDLWEDDEIGKNFRAIAEYLDVSDGLVRRVYYEHFGEEGGEKTFEQLDKDRELEELIEERDGFVYIDETLDEDLPIEDYEGKSIPDVLEEISGEQLSDLIRTVWSHGHAQGKQDGLLEGYRAAVQDFRDDQKESDGGLVIE